MIGSPEVFGVSIPRVVERLEDAVGLAPHLAADRVAAASVDLEARDHGRERCDRRRPRVEVRRCQYLQRVLQRRRQCEERQQRGVGLREAGDEDRVVVRARRGDGRCCCPSNRSRRARRGAAPRSHRSRGHRPRRAAPDTAPRELGESLQVRARCRSSSSRRRARSPAGTGTSCRPAAPPGDRGRRGGNGRSWRRAPPRTSRRRRSSCGRGRRGRSCRRRPAPG